MAKRNQSFAETLKDGAMWTLIFFGLFLMTCKWLSGA